MTRLRRALHARLARDDRGATAMEFALIALPLFVMIFAIMEIALVFMVYTSLENATSDAARTIRTGAFQQGATPTAAQFKTDICNHLGWLQASCSGNLSVDVRTFTAFANASAPSPVQNGTWQPQNLTFSPGAACDIVLVRSYFQWKLLTPFLNAGLQNLNGGYKVITASTTFRNEPYGNGGC